jgi:hypothetical protein
MEHVAKGNKHKLKPSRDVPAVDQWLLSAKASFIKCIIRNQKI